MVKPIWPCDRSFSEESRPENLQGPSQAKFSSKAFILKDFIAVFSNVLDIALNVKLQ